MGLLAQDVAPATDATPTAEEVKEKELEVVLGIDYIEKLTFAPNPKGIFIGNEAILTYSVAPQKRELILKGLKVGKSSVVVRDNSGDIKAKYTINVSSNNLSKVVQELKEFLGDVEGLEIGIKGNYVYVGGQIVVPTDIGRIAVVLEKFPEVVRLVELSTQTQRVIAKKMQEEIQSAGMKDVSVRVANSIFMLEGVVGSDGLKGRAEEVAAVFLPDKLESLAKRTDSVQSAKKSPIQNFIQVNAKSEPPPAPKLLKITAQFVELSKDYNKVFGFKWAPTLGANGGQIAFGKTTDGGVTTQSSGTLAGTISNLFPKLENAKNAGHARVMQSGVIIVKDGIKGTLKKESKKPYAVGTGEFTKADTATAGFNLNVKPTILADEKVEMELGLNVSTNIGNPPETLTNDISTIIVVKSKESAVVGGVVIKKNSQTFDRNPNETETASEGGSFLFTFIRSKSFLSDRNQFVVFVTPEIIDSASEGTEEIKKKFRKKGR